MFKLLLSFVLASAMGLAQWVQLPTPMSFPVLNSFGHASYGSTCQINASGEAAGLIQRVPKTGNITHVLVRTAGVTSAQALSVGLETVGTNGFNTTTAYGGSAAGSISTPAANTYYEVALATPAAATVNDMVSVVIQFSGTIGDVTIQSGYNAPLDGYVTCNTGSWAKSGYGPHVRFRYAGEAVEYPPMVDVPGVPAAPLAWNSNSTTNLYGNRITLRSPVRAYGVAAYMYSTLQGSTKFQLRDINGNLIKETRVIDHDELSSNTYQNKAVPFDSPVTIPAGQYYVMLESQSTSYSTGLYYFVPYSTAYMYQSVYASQDIAFASRTSAGVYSVNTAQQAQVALLIDQVWGVGGGFVGN